MKTKVLELYNKKYLISDISRELNITTGRVYEIIQQSKREKVSRIEYIDFVLLVKEYFTLKEGAIDSDIQLRLIELKKQIKEMVGI